MPSAPEATVLIASKPAALTSSSEDTAPPSKTTTTTAGSAFDVGELAGVGGEITTLPDAFDQISSEVASLGNEGYAQSWSALGPGPNCPSSNDSVQ